VIGLSFDVVAAGGLYPPRLTIAFRLSYQPEHFCSTAKRPVMPEAMESAHPTARSVHSKVILHIGLPKTATTFLQHSIFKWIDQIAYIHRKYDDQDVGLTAALKRFVRATRRQVDSRRTELRESFGEILERMPGNSSPPRVLVSDENISMAAKDFWSRNGPTPQLVCERLGQWKEDMGLPDGAMRVLLGIRRQDHWIASRYAQSAVEYAQFSQRDFDERLAEICNSELTGSKGWIDYAFVHSLLVSIFGRENVYFMPMELLKRSPEETLIDMGRFLGDIDLLRIYRDNLETGRKAKSPSREVAPNTWRLRKSDALITLTAQHTRTVLRRFHESNRQLAEQTGLDLAQLLYFE
jgi:hypothetical protein